MEHGSTVYVDWMSARCRSRFTFTKILNLSLLPQPRIAHRYAKLWANLHDEESDALIGLVRICEERGGDSLAYSKATRICPAQGGDLLDTARQLPADKDHRAGRRLSALDRAGTAPEGPAGRDRAQERACRDNDSSVSET
jgi:hypothetical protein